MLHVIVDGYNLIRQIPALSRAEKLSLEHGRNILVRLLSQYKKIKRHKITLVFDGDLNLSEFAPAFKEGGIEVRFSPYGSSADDVIKKMLSVEKERALVVSSDRSILIHAEKQKSTTISSPDFYDKLLMTQLMSDAPKDLMKEKSGPQHKRWTTYKKGPSKKAPKKDRKNLQRLKKL